ncbi:MAG TPA: TlpA disulfide reductase family protein [Candidatus Saccharimonadales bacterium]|nr:TlpA disulfide reductase family protein [Candidatus Saccharimonadales bacterium]
MIGIIALASLAALLWPVLPFNDRARSAPTRVGVITASIEAPDTAPVVGRQAPDFRWIDPDGRTRSLGSLRGTPVVLNFWATWCVPCRTELPAMERVAAERREVTFLAIDLDEDGGKVRDFFDSLGIVTLQPIIDLNGTQAKRYGVVGLPTTLFIGPDGVIRQITIDAMTDDTLRSGLAKAAK